MSDKNILNSILSKLRYLLQQMNYPNHYLNMDSTKLRVIIEMNYYRLKNKAGKSVISYVSTHNPKNLEFFQMLRLPFSFRT